MFRKREIGRVENLNLDKEPERGSNFSVKNQESLENFEKKQEILSNQIKIINLVAEKLKKKYSKYEVLATFIDHLASTEKIFVIAKSENSGFVEVKNSFLNAETQLMSSQLGFEPLVFEQITEIFRDANNNVAGIITTAENLKRLYVDDKKIIEFINYMEKVLLAFLEITDNYDVNIDIDKQKILEIEKYMSELSANGDPQLEKLKEIYEEFKEELKKIKQEKKNAN